MHFSHALPAERTSAHQVLESVDINCIGIAIGIGNIQVAGLDSVGGAIVRDVQSDFALIGKFKIAAA